MTDLLNQSSCLQTLFQKILEHFRAPCFANAQDALKCHDVLCSDTLQVRLLQLAHRLTFVLRLLAIPQEQYRSHCQPQAIGTQHG